MASVVATADHALRWRIATLERQLEEAKSGAAGATTTLAAAQETINLLAAKVAQRESELSAVRTELVEQQGAWAARTKKAKEKSLQLTCLEEAVVDVILELNARCGHCVCVHCVCMCERLRIPAG